MAPVREVAFELECFEWAGERLEVAGRWKGLAGQRLARPVLTLQTESGRRKRLLAMPGEQGGAGADSWRATFAWAHDPADITGAALEVGGNLVVDLPLPDRRRRRRRRPASENGDESLRAEVGALRAQVGRLRAELAGREREIIQLGTRLEEQTGDGPADAEPRADADAMTVDIERLAGERDAARAELSAEAGRLAGEREQAEARLQSEIDNLREAFSEAAAEAESVRERHRAAVEALQDELRIERAEVARLSAELAARDETRAFAGPPTEALPAPTEAPPATAEHTPPAPPNRDATGEDTDRDVTAGSALVDPPGPLRAGGHPASPVGSDPEPRRSRVPAWLRSGGADAASEETVAFQPADPDADTVTDPDASPPVAPIQALKARLDAVLSSNGTASAADAPEDLAVPRPRPRRSVAPARARAGATVAARRNPAEVWGMRILAATVVVVLLTVFLLILTSIA